MNKDNNAKEVQEVQEVKKNNVSDDGFMQKFYNDNGFQYKKKKRL